VFFCQYNFDVEGGRSRLSAELKRASGGPLGIESATELVIGVRDLAAAKRDWSSLLGPARIGGEPLWQIGPGPAIRLVAAKEDHLVLLRVKVKSLERARAFLKGQNVLGIDGEHEISLDPTQIAGADIRFVQ
jgi:hypothetical protein